MKLPWKKVRNNNVYDHDCHEQKRDALALNHLAKRQREEVLALRRRMDEDRKANGYAQLFIDALEVRR